jgi:hypothetical protein
MSLNHCPTCTCQPVVPACSICERVIPGGMHMRYCIDCFSEWYDGGERDPVKIKAKVLAMHETEQK